MSNLIKENTTSSEKPNVLRLNNHNVLSYVRKIAWLYITPFVGLYSTFYSKNRFDNSYIWREAPETGISVSTKTYKIFHHGFSFLGERIDEMRHILTPKVSYSYIHPPTTSKTELFSFDGIDDLERQESVIFSLGNKLQVRNKKRTWDFLYFEPSLERSEEHTSELQSH